MAVIFLRKPARQRLFSACGIRIRAYWKIALDVMSGKIQNRNSQHTPNTYGTFLKFIHYIAYIR